MDRQFVCCHRLKSKTSSVKAKTLFDYLVSQMKARRELPLAVWILITWDKVK